jgi:hypothetical protein
MVSTPLFVFPMSQHGLDEYRPSPVMNKSNHAVFVSTHVKDRQIADEVRWIEGPPDLTWSSPPHALNRIRPVQ